MRTTGNRGGIIAFLSALAADERKSFGVHHATALGDT
jgi:hypothetical protein